MAFRSRHKAPPPDKQKILAFESTLKERFEGVPPPQRELAITIAREQDYWLHRALQPLILGQIPAPHAERQAACNLDMRLRQFPALSADEIAEQLEQLPSLRNAIGEGTRLTRTSIHRAYMVVHRDPPEVAVENLKGPFKYEDMRRICRYAIDQGFTTKADVMRDWRQTFSSDKQPVELEGKMDPVLERQFGRFLMDAHLPEWRKKAAGRSPAIVQPAAETATPEGQPASIPMGSVFSRTKKE